MRDEADLLTVEMELDRLGAALAGDDPPRWSAGRRRTVTRALELSGLRTNALTLLRRHAPMWIEHEPAVAAARLTTPSWAAYHRLRAAQDAISDELFGAAWIDVLRWHGGVPAGPLPPPAAIPSMTAGWATGSLPLPWRPLIAQWQREVFPALREGGAASIEVTFAAGRPHAQVTAGGRVQLHLRDERDMPRAWCHLLHELGHAAAALLADGAGLPFLPRAVDEAVAAWAARHLEEEGSAPGLPRYDASSATSPALHAAERARRVAVAGALAHLEAQLHVGQSEGAAGLPWALWHDGGAQAAYLHAEVLAEAWWQRGLRLTSPRAALVAAIAQACDEAAALPPPLPKLAPRAS